MNQKKTPLIIPIIYSVTAVIWMVAFGLKLYLIANHLANFDFLALTYLVCGILLIVSAIIYWLRYRKNIRNEEN